MLFVGSSFLDVTRNEENDEEEDNYGTDEDVEDDAVSTEERISRIVTIAADRRRAFVVDCGIIPLRPGLGERRRL